ncbi:glycosyltransferase family 2 protein [soil metagenome]
MTAISVIILTKDEESLIGRCIDSVCWADEVLVVDSGSSDRTIEVARSHGATVLEQPWLGWPRQRNTAAAAAKHDWVFFVEADEVVSPALATSVRATFAGRPDPRDGFHLDRRDDFLGVMLPNQSNRVRRRAFVRIYNRRCSRYDPTMRVHEEVQLDGVSRPLHGRLLHCRGSSMDELVSTLNRYATTEAAALSDHGVRSSWLHIVGRPLLRFGWCYLVKGGFRLGTRGVAHAMLRAFSEFVRFVKLWELQHDADDRGLEPTVTLAKDRT